MRRTIFRLALIGVLSLQGVGCREQGAVVIVPSSEGAAAVDEKPPAEAERIARMAVSEDAFLEVMPRLRALGESVVRGALPDESAAGHFGERVEVLVGEGGGQSSGRRISVPGMARRDMGNVVGGGAWISSPGELGVWKGIFAEAERFENAAFYFAGGDLVERMGKRVFVADAGFSGLMKRKVGGWRALSGKVVMEWTEADGDWKITKWVQGGMAQTDTDDLLFREVLDEVLPDEVARSRARFSYHEKNLIDLFQRGSFDVTKPIHAEFKDLDSSMQHPALSVVDIDRDGWDDLYVMGRWGRNLMLRNRGDGTMEDVAGKMGLDLEGLCNCACFADFDNDGDDDVFLGRSLERSLYLRNDGGVFVDGTKEAFGKMPLPYLVSTISAADYDGDGLLDVYLGMYGPTARDGEVEDWGPKFMPAPMVAEMVKRKATSHRYLNLLGPPNLLLKNAGGGTFRVAPEAGALAEWHNTHEGCWSDFDGDGDVDLYVCNDFAPDHLYRQDVDEVTGKRSFVEISQEMAGKGMQGFGMGASWGDYDRDGDLDLYVSNMYSKAGKRIMGAIDGLDERLPYSAEGNLLFRNDGERFEQVAGGLGVAKAGWAYGAQWVDVDNDGWLDAYSSSGFYTAPKEIRTDKDL